MPPIVTSSRRRPRQNPPHLVLTVVSALVLCVLVIVYIKLQRPQAPAPQAPGAEPPAPDTGSVLEAPSATPDAPPPTHPTTEPPAPSAPPAATNSFVKRPGTLMLPSGKILTFPPPAPGKVEMIYADGHLYECDSEGNWTDKTKRKLFKTAFELNFLGLALDGGRFIPTFLLGLDQDKVVEILKKDYVAIGDETEEELAQIQAYLEMKAAALDYIEQGGKFDDFVSDIASFVQAERNVRAKSLRQVMLLYKEGRYDEARSRALELEKILKEQGYKPMTIPPHVREKLGI